jgi:carboxyl-terminal processing protease
MGSRSRFAPFLCASLALVLGVVAPARSDDIIKLAGIGAALGRDAVTEQALILTPFRGGPAHKAGLFAGDRITAITRKVDEVGNPLPRPETTPTRGLSRKAVHRLLLGLPDTRVTLTVQRHGVKKPFDVEVTRAEVAAETVVGVRRTKDAAWDHVIDSKNRIGYIRLLRFDRRTIEDLEVVMKDLVRNRKIKGLVLDLRFNPGGLLDIAIKVTDLFIDDGLIVSIHPRDGADKATRFYGRHTDSLLDFPMVCLVNGYSASGSEIVSAALQDHRRAIIMGERSYGKGSVQNIRDFEITPDGAKEPQRAEIRLTTHVFRRPSGENLDRSMTGGRDDEKWGVVPDRVVKLTLRERIDLLDHLRTVERIEHPDRLRRTTVEDRQLAAALEHLRGRLKKSN